MKHRAILPLTLCVMLVLFAGRASTQTPSRVTGYIASRTPDTGPSTTASVLDPPASPTPSPLSPASAGEKWVGTYMVSWELDMGSGTGTGGSVLYTDIDFNTFTHLYMFAGGLDASGNVQDNNLAVGSGSPRMRFFNDWVHTNKPGKAVIYTIGGSSASAFATAINSAGSRTNLVNNLLYRIDYHHYDGIDIDIEVGFTAASMVTFINQLWDSMQVRTARYDASRKPMILTAIYPRLSGASAWATAQAKLDQINIMTYDLESGQGWGWHNQALRSRDDAGNITNRDGSSAEAATVEKRYLETVALGIPPSKLSISTSTNAKFWTSGTGPKTSSGSYTDNMVYNSSYSSIGGSTVYNYVNTGVAAGRRYYDVLSQACYIRDADGTGWLTYQDEQMIDTLVGYGYRQGVGGFFSWGYGEGWDPSNPVPDHLHRQLWNSVAARSGPPQIPAAPALVSPLNGATNQFLTPTLSWSWSAGATSYRVEISTSSTFTTTIYNQTGIATTSISVPGGTLGYTTTYYWRVNATNTAGTSTWSAVRSFSTGSAVNPPPSPTLSAPANGSTSVATNPTLSWNTASGATSYSLQVSTSSSFSSTVINQTNLTSTSFGASGLATNTTYYWRVNAANTGGTSAWSTAWSFTTGSGVTVPQPPVLSSPVNGATNQPTTLLLSWISSAGATSYRVQVSTSSSFSSTVFNQSGVTATSVSVSGLNPSVIYYWRANATNTAGTSGWSSVWSFTTATNVSIPQPPVLSFPPDGASAQATAVLLMWNPSTGAASYRVQVSTSAVFSSTVLDQSGVTATSASVSGLDASRTYHWRVSATNSAGTSGWSAVWDFSTATQSDLPPAPDLVSPEAASTGIPTQSTFRWDPVDLASTYDLQIATNYSFNDIIAMHGNIAGTSYSVSGIPPQTTLYWRARGVSDQGPGQWSDRWRFTTVPLASPVLLAPVNGQTEISLQPVLHWMNCDGALSYRLQLSATYNFASTILNDGEVTDTSRAVDNLAPNTHYYWRVNASNDGGTSNWSGVNHFTTVPASPVLQSPSDASTGIPLQTVFTWISIDAASAFQLQISTVSNFSTTIVDSTGISSTTFTMSDLQPNTTYYWRVCETNFGGTSAWSTIWDLQTVIIPRMRGTIYVDLNQNGVKESGEPGMAGWTVLLSGDKTDSTVSDADGNYLFDNLATGSYTISERPHPEWSRTAPAGQGTYTRTLTTSQPVFNGNFGNYSPSAFGFPVQRAWNMISIPITTPSHFMTTVLPTAVTDAFTFSNNAYVQTDTVIPGNGYWVKFPAAHQVWMTGSPITDGTIPLAEGWNMIGSFSEPLAVSELGTLPQSILLSPIYGYGRGFFIADTIKPGRGYWVQSAANGELAPSDILPSDGQSFGKSVAGRLNSLTLNTGTGESQTLFFGLREPGDRTVFATELPPPPPAGVFDARFAPKKPSSQGDAIHFLDASVRRPVQIPIIVRSATSPLSLSWSVAGGGAHYTVSMNGRKLIDLEGSGTADLDIKANKDGIALILTATPPRHETIPGGVLLLENYPNPFNPTTFVNYNLPEDAFVRLEIYNLLGERIMTLTDEEQPRGEYQVVFDATDLPSGTYMARIEARSAGGKSERAHRMLLVK